MAKVVDPSHLNRFIAKTLVMAFLFIPWLGYASEVNTSPSLLYSTYFGGNQLDSIADVAVDQVGNVYVTGSTRSSNFPLLNAYQSTLSDSGNAFLAKFSPQGNLIFSTYLGDGGSSGRSIAIDSSGNPLVLINRFSSTIYVYKLSSDGQTLIFSALITNIGSNTSGKSLAIDSSGAIYVAGSTNSSNFPVVNAYQNTFGGDISGNFIGDGFITKLSDDGSTILFSTYLGSISSDVVNDITVDTLGNVYAIGTTFSNNFPTLNAYDSNLNDGSSSAVSDVFVSKLSDNGQLLWSTYLGGYGLNGGERGWGITHDASGVYLTGQTSSVNFPVVNPFQSNLKGNSDIFVSKLTLDGQSLIYSTYLGGTTGGNEEGLDIVVNELGNAFITGYSTASDFPLMNPVQNSRAGSTDAVVAMLSNDGASLLFSTYFGGGIGPGHFGHDAGSGIAIDQVGNIYFAGDTVSESFPTLNAFQPTHGRPDNSDGFLVKLGSNNAVPIADAGANQTVFVDSLVTLDGSASSDPDNNTLTYLWSENTSNPQGGLLSNPTAINPTLIPTIPGSYTFWLTVNDGAVNSSPDSVTITVQTPLQATESLIDTVETFNLQQGIENSLDAKLDAAINALNDLNENNNSAAINALQAFINAVEAQRGNKITNEQADILIQEAQTIINHLVH